MMLSPKRGALKTKNSYYLDEKIWIDVLRLAGSKTVSYSVT